jgi:hypothetical protein
MMQFAPTFVASKKFPTLSTAGRLLTIHNRSQELEMTSTSKPLRSISLSPIVIAISCDFQLAKIIEAIPARMIKALTDK